MIARIWHGWTTPERAGQYDRLLKEEIFPSIERKKVRGYLGIELLRRDLDDEVEFITIMWFDSIRAVKEFAGEEYETAYVPEGARKVLKRFDETSQHYRVSKPAVFAESEAYPEPGAGP